VGLNQHRCRKPGQVKGFSDASAASLGPKGCRLFFPCRLDSSAVTALASYSAIHSHALHSGRFLVSFEAAITSEELALVTIIRL
jgi:hypothetical protein